MTISEALRRAIDDAGWSATKLAAEVGVSENAVKKWLAGSTPGGESLLALQRKLPGFAELLQIEGAA